MMIVNLISYEYYWKHRTITFRFLGNEVWISKTKINTVEQINDNF